MRRVTATICLAMLLGSTTHAQDKQQKNRFCVVGAKDLVDASAPRFDQYTAEVSEPFVPAKLDLLSSPIAKTYRTVLRQEIKSGPNFAGQYRVAIWGCGASCAQFAVVNLKTGRVITVNGMNSVSGGQFAANQFLSGTDSGAWGFRFKKDSRLLVIVGEINENEARKGAFYYELKNENLRNVHTTVAAPNTCEDENVEPGC